MREVIGTVVVAIVVVIILGLIISYPVMLLWNGCLVGAVAGVNPITWMQAWGILILSGFLFKSVVSQK